jgi:hypothetical protein
MCIGGVINGGKVVVKNARNYAYTSACTFMGCTGLTLPFVLCHHYYSYINVEVLHLMYSPPNNAVYWYRNAGSFTLLKDEDSEGTFL